MGLLSALTNNASEVTNEEVQKELGSVLVPDEQIEAAYKLVRDLFVFTDRRLILVDKQGVTGKKVQYHTIPYRSITHFAVETAGTFDMESELIIWISSASQPLQKTFSKGSNIAKIQQALAAAVTKK